MAAEDAQATAANLGQSVGLQPVPESVAPFELWETMNRRHVLVGFAAILVSSLAGCGPEVSDPPSEAGPAPWSVDSEPALRIGATEGSEGPLFQRIASVRLLDGGGVAVADQGSATISVFGPDGAEEVEWGGEGEGPGEFEWVNHLEVAGDTVLVHDPGLLRFTAATRAGDVLDTRSYVTDEGRPEIVLGRYPDGGWAMAWIDQSALGDFTQSPADPMVVGRFAADGRLVRRLGDAHGMVRTRYESGGTGPAPLSPWFHGVLVGESAVFTNGQEPVFWVVGPDGEEPRRVEIGFSTPNPEAARAALEAELRDEDNEDRIQGMGDDVWNRPVPAIGGLLAGENGRVWVKRFDPAADSWLVGGAGRGGPGGSWVVLDLDGRTVGEVEMPPELIPTDVRDDRVAGITVDELGVQRAAVQPAAALRMPPLQARPNASPAEMLNGEGDQYGAHLCHQGGRGCRVSGKDELP